MSGCTTLMRPLNTVGLPKTMYIVPGRYAFLAYLPPLNHVRSITDVPSEKCATTRSLRGPISKVS